MVNGDPVAGDLLIRDLLWNDLRAVAHHRILDAELVEIRFVLRRIVVELPHLRTHLSIITLFIQMGGLSSGRISG